MIPALTHEERRVVRHLSGREGQERTTPTLARTNPAKLGARLRKKAARLRRRALQKEEKPKRAG